MPFKLNIRCGITLTLTAILSVYFTTAGYSQNIITDGKIWSIIKTDFQDTTIKSIEYFHFRGDTVIDGTRYKITERSLSTGNPEWFYYGLTREDQHHKVFFRYTVETSEYLIYDLNTRPGDTVKAAGIASINKKEYMTPVTYLVKSTGFIVSENVRHRMLNLAEIHSPYFTCEHWLDQIGSQSGLFHNSSGRSDRDQFSLLCLTENNQLLYKHVGSATCNWPEKNSPRPLNPTFQLSPVPLESHSALRLNPGDTSRTYSISFYNCLLQPIFSTDFSKELVINRILLNPGFYFFKITDDIGIIHHRKLPIK